MGHGRTGRERGKGLNELFAGTNSQDEKRGSNVIILRYL